MLLPIHCTNRVPNCINDTLSVALCLWISTDSWITDYHGSLMDSKAAMVGLIFSLIVMLTSSSPHLPGCFTLGINVANPLSDREKTCASCSAKSLKSHVGVRNPEGVDTGRVNIPWPMSIWFVAIPLAYKDFVILYISPSTTNLKCKRFCLR